MTREEAKDLLQNIAAYDIDRQKGMAKQEALDMAIKALEQEPCEDAVSRQVVIEAIEMCKVDPLDKIRSEIAEEAKCTIDVNRAGGLYKALQIIDKYKAESEE